MLASCKRVRKNKRKKMIRVLHVLGAMNRGGIETFIMNVFRTIDRTQIGFDFLVNSRRNDYAAEIERLGGRIYYLPPRSEGFRAFRKNVDRFFAVHAGEYRAVHQHVASLSSVEALAAARKYGTGVRIVHAHSSNMKGSKWHYLLHFYHKLSLRKLATCYLACSDTARHWLYGYTGCYGRSVVVNNGIPAADFVFDPETRSRVRNRLGLLREEIAVCHVGSFIPVKNHVFLFDVFRELRKIDSRYKLFLVGDGPLKAHLHEVVRAGGLDGSVFFLGLRADVNRLMQAFDCLVFPSLFEGLPVTLVEAQAADLPVVASDRISPMARLVDDTELLPLTWPAARWAEIVRTKMQGRLRRNRSDLLRQAGFDIGAVAEKLNKFYIG